MAEDRVVSLFGGPTGERKVNALCVEGLEELLMRARAGEIVGIACAALHSDGLSSCQTSGLMGGYSLVGALQVLSADLVELARKK